MATWFISCVNTTRAQKAISAWMSGQSTFIDGMNMCSYASTSKIACPANVWDEFIHCPTNTKVLNSCTDRF